MSILESHIQVMEPSSARPEVQEVFSDFKQRMGLPIVPNVMAVLGHSSDVATGTWDVIKHVLVLGRLPRVLKEMIIMVISIDRGCTYCKTAHASICRQLGISDEVLESLSGDLESFRPVHTRDILRFGLKCSRFPQDLTQEDFQKLERHGLSQEEILEVVAMSALSVYINTIVDATGIPVDSIFTG